MANAAALNLIAINPADDFLSADAPSSKQAPSARLDYEALQDREEELMLRSLVARKQNRIRLTHWN